MDGPVGDRFMTTSPIFWYTGVVLLMLAVHYGKPRLFFSAKPTAEQILASVQRFRVSVVYTRPNVIVVAVVVGRGDDEKRTRVTADVFDGRRGRGQRYGAPANGQRSHVRRR